MNNCTATVFNHWHDLDLTRIQDVIDMTQKDYNPVNPIQAVYRSRIKGVYELCEAAGNMGHSGIIGDLREFYLRGLLKGFMPPGVSVRSGIVCDCRGMCSRQLDFVVTLDSSLPVQEMKDDVSLIPYDSVLMYIEFKSRIDTNALKQVEEQRESIQPLTLSNEPASRFIFPAMLLGIDSASLSYNYVSEWMTSHKDVSACCVIGKYAIQRHGDETIGISASTDEKDLYRETLFFLNAFHVGLKYLIDLRNHEPVITEYLLQGVSPSDLIQ